MPLQVLNIPQFGFKEANPVLVGMQQSGALGQQISDYLSQSLKRKQNEQIFPTLMALKQAETQREQAKAEMPFGGTMLPGPAGQALGLEIMKRQYGENSEQYQNALKGFKSNLANQTSLMNTRDIRNASIPWAQMPAPNKQFNLAQAHSMGYSYDEASQAFSQGKTLPELAQKKGLNPQDPSSWPVPQPAPTTANLTQQGRSNVALAGINAIEPKVTELLKPYSTKITNDMSPVQIMQSLKGTNKKEIGKAMGASMAAQELALLRARSGGVQNIGIEMLRESLNASGNRLHIPGVMRDPEIYEEAQNTIRELLNDLNRAENRAMYNMAPVDEGYYSGSESKADKNAIVKLVLKNGKLVESK